ncbi:MAG: DEAD/DEAH box helicase family protein [Bacillota bacterium]
MSSLKCFVYLAWGSHGYRMDITHDPMLDLRYLSKHCGYEQMMLLSPAIPVGMASYLLNRMASAKEQAGKSILDDGNWLYRAMSRAGYHRDSEDAFIKTKCRVAEKILRQILPGALFQPDIIREPEVRQTLLPSERDLGLVRDALAGRILYISELEQLLAERGIYPESHLENILHILHLQGNCLRKPSIEYLAPGEMSCRRCGGWQAISQTYCVDCGNQQCYYCEECLAMGEARLCKPLYAVPGMQKNVSPLAEESKVSLSITLTRAQKDAAVALRNFARREGGGECLVWAVCGAGKTEVSFWAIWEILRQGKKVLFAIPRKDVVLELEPRIRRAFPDQRVLALFGGAQEKYREAEIIVATTHQAIRFYRSFDLVVLDEVDAFPYHGNTMLFHAVERARQDNGKIIYMTATPGGKLYRRTEKGEVTLVKIPARHHGYPLPEPKIITGQSLVDSGEGEMGISSKVLDLLHLSLEGDLAQIFVFVPSVHLAQVVGKALKSAITLPPFNNFTGDWVQYSHSRDPERDSKCQRFGRGEFPVFVTTTILERGITISRANVIVLFAESEKIFDAGALIQMAGRSGRSEEYPEGRVWFVGVRTTPAMHDAVGKIKSMNLEARRLGYLREQVIPVNREGP